MLRQLAEVQPCTCGGMPPQGNFPCSAVLPCLLPTDPFDTNRLRASFAILFRSDELPKAELYLPLEDQGLDNEPTLPGYYAWSEAGSC